jgi:hypothetical protein
MSKVVTLAEQFADALGIDESLIIAIQVGDSVHETPLSTVSRGKLYNTKVWADVFVGDSGIRNASVVFVGNDVYDVDDLSNHFREFLTLYVSPAAKLETVKDMYQDIFG